MKKEYMSRLRVKTDLNHWKHLQAGGAFYIALEDANLAFTEDELGTVTEMWQEGRHIADISLTLGRPDTEISVLIMDLANKYKIGRRPGGVLGVPA